MRSHEITQFNKFGTILAKEMRTLFASPSLWFMLLIETPIVGYGFTQAVFLYAQASRSALKFAELAKGMEPIQGIFVPTFGALYLTLTLLFPFVAIRMIRREIDSNSLKLLLQTPTTPVCVVLAKVVALIFAWLLALLPVLFALLIWLCNGGHVFWPALLVLVSGYALYALLIIGIAFAASVTTDSPTSAAILTLAATLGVWVLDFASGTNGLLHIASTYSPTESLRQLETGMLSAPVVVPLLTFAIGLLSATIVCLPPGIAVRTKLQRCLIIGAISIAALFTSRGLRLYIDVSEDSHNSFNPAFERVLRTMSLPLTITVHLSADDSRLQEMEHNVFAKLRRNIPDLHIVYSETSSQSLFTNVENDQYGLIVYNYAGKDEEGRSNSPTEILPLLFKLSGQTVEPEAVPAYPGYPLVVERTNAELLFYFLLPAVIVGCWVRSRLPRA